MKGYSYKWHLPNGNKQFEATTYGETEKQALSHIKRDHPKRIVVVDSIKMFHKFD